jgi:polyisoprenoid-binding protein YceI
MKKLALLAIASFAHLAFAEPVTFTVTGTQNLASVESVTVHENFVGRTGEVSGQIVFDPTTQTGSGTIVVNGASIETGNPSRDRNMRGPEWLDFDAQPDILFETTSVTPLEDDTYQVAGNLTMKGQTQPVSTTATVRLLPASPETQELGFAGDVLVLNTQFEISLASFGVERTGESLDSVNDTLTVQLAAFGLSE